MRSAPVKLLCLKGRPGRMAQRSRTHRTCQLRVPRLSKRLTLAPSGWLRRCPRRLTRGTPRRFRLERHAPAKRRAAGVFVFPGAARANQVVDDLARREIEHLAECP